ncbi:MAG: alkaline phosphatase family protein [Clostridia bacterium]|nr:alkaline phosphatase family protein [Clostridia bacterium]
MAYVYSHVVIVGIDGAGNFYKKTETPVIDRLFREGAGTDRCLTSLPSISAECWGSMLTGVPPEVHGLTNSIVEREPYVNKDHPTIFKLIRDARSEAVLASFSNWSPINTGIVEGGLDVDFDSGDDAELTERICSYIKDKKPVFLFVQLDNVDGAGHSYGYGSDKYLETLSRADGHLGKIRAAVEEAGIADDTLFIATADHGGLGQSHGGDSDEEKYVFFAAVGKTVPKGSVINLEVKDIPAIVARALGVKGAPNWNARLPEGLFTE